MKRVHRCWHRRIGCLLLPVIGLTLAWLCFAPATAPTNAALPPALSGESVQRGATEVARLRRCQLDAIQAAI